MIYGNKLKALFVIILSLFIIGCSNDAQNWSYELYDGYEIREIDKKVTLYKNDELFVINDLNYQIKAFKYNSDVVCLELKNGDYYMIYYFDGSIYGPYTKDSLNDTTLNYSMSFDNDFININKLEGKIYE